MSKRLAKLFKPCDRLDKYDDEPYTKNPLLHIRLSEIRQKRHYSYLQRKAAEVSWSLLDFWKVFKTYFDLALDLES